MKETINHLLRHPQGLWIQSLGSLKRSAGSVLHIALFEHAGRSQQLAGLVLRHGGISREEALRVVGSFSKPSAAPAEAANNPQPPEPVPTQAAQPPRQQHARMRASRPPRVRLHRT